MLFLSLLLLLTTVVQAFYPAGTKVQELSTATFDTTVYQTKVKKNIINPFFTVKEASFCKVLQSRMLPLPQCRAHLGCRQPQLGCSCLGGIGELSS